MDLDDARALAMELPSTHEEHHFELTSFRVGTKIIATAPVDGDHSRIFVDESEIKACVAEAPNTFEEQWWGQNLVGVKVTLARADPQRVAELLEEAWRRKAPKRVIATYDDFRRHDDTVRDG